MQNPITRRQFARLLGAATTGSMLARYHAMAAPEKGRVKIRDLKIMVVQGPRTYTLVKIITDSGLYGIGEGYGNPGVGVKEQMLALKPDLIGKDPLEIDAIYTGLGQRTDGSAHALLRAVSGIEMGLWDLAGKILGVPATTLLGGRFRDRVQVYDHAAPRNMLDPKSCRDWAAKVKADASGFTIHKFGPQHTTPATDANRDRSNRLLTGKELTNIRRGFENCREAVGWDHDIMVHCHWEYDLRTSLQLADAVEAIRPMWLEDPMPPDYSDSWKRLVAGSKVPIATGENLARREGFKDFIINQGLDIVHLDVRNTGGLLESKRIADLAHVFALPVANHNTGSMINTLATIQWGASIQDYIACETVVGQGGWMDEIVLHEGGPIIKQGHITLPNKPGLGIELNPDVVKAHLATGETYWG